MWHRVVIRMAPLTSIFLVSLLAQSELPRRGALGVPLSSAPETATAALKLAPGVGLVAGAPLENLTAAKAGIRAGDIIVRINDHPAVPQGIGAYVRGLEVGKPVEFHILRDGKALDLSAPLVEKPKDPGNRNFTVEYSSIVSHGQRMRTIITKPTRAGKHPGLFFIQGFSPISYDYTLATAKGDVSTIDGPILNEMANSGYVTMRVEKPGVGDSEGGPFETLDYVTELDIYRQAMKQLQAVSSVDTGNIFIFGHSMGGSFGPMVACEFPVKGLIVYGTAGRTWFEYLMDTIRYQGLVAGQSYTEVDNETRKGAQIMALAMIEKKSAAEIKAMHPELSAVVDAYFPNGMFNGKTLDFWRQLNDINFADYWSRCKSHVLAVRGVADFVTYDADHKLIVDIINRARPGEGKFQLLPNSDHLFHNFPTEQASMQNFQRGKFNNAFAGVMKKWIQSVMG
jgi:uncharacterized protein